MPVSAVIIAPAKPPWNTKCRRVSSKIASMAKGSRPTSIGSSMRMMAMASCSPWTHSPRPVTPASVSTLTQTCMQWPTVAAVLIEVIFIGQMLSRAWGAQAWTGSLSVSRGPEPRNRCAAAPS